MNVYLLSLLDTIVEQTMCNFSKLYMVKSVVCLDADHQVAKQIKIVIDFYIKFFQHISFLPKGIQFLRRMVFGVYDLKEDIDHADVMISYAMDYLRGFQLTENCVAVPVHARYGNAKELLLCTGLGWMENKSKISLLLTELAFPKDKISAAPDTLKYVTDILKSFELDSQQLREFLKSEGYNYNQFQRDCKIYLGDTFYRFVLKRKMISAVQDIVFSELSLKEIAFKNKFADYTNMYKTFRSFGLNLSEVPRISNF